MNSQSAWRSVDNTRPRGGEAPAFGVILSEAKDLFRATPNGLEILRVAQDDGARGFFRNCLTLLQRAKQRERLRGFSARTQ